jgi:hypothetical protein
VGSGRRRKSGAIPLPPEWEGADDVEGELVAPGRAPTGRHVRGRPRGTLLTCTLLGIAAVLSACASGSPGQSVASLPGHTTATAAASGTLSQSQSDQDIVDFTHCLRARGVNEPDPFTRPGHSGLTFAMPPDTASNHSAIGACEHFISKIVAAKQAGASQELARWLPSLVRYAACMRAHDVPMLDPGPQGELNLGNVPGITSDFGRYSPQFRAADHACRHLLPAGVHDDGTGP